MTDQISYGGPAWIVAYVDANAEKDVAAEIAQAGYGVYLPVQRMRGKPGRPIVTRPLFPRYVFAEVDHGSDWGHVRHVRGVVDVVTNDGRPCRVPAALLQRLWRAEAYGAFDYTKSAKDPFQPGEEVRIGAGTFSGFNAVIERYVAKMRSATASKRVKVLLEFMGAMRELEIDVCDLETI